LSLHGFGVPPQLVWVGAIQVQPGWAVHAGDVVAPLHGVTAPEQNPLAAQTHPGCAAQTVEVALSLQATAIPTHVPPLGAVWQPRAAEQLPPKNEQDV